ncbi:MAG: hypothetical protein J0I75_17455 [Hyphomicrobium sp.]|nr:hypothetical protein [Hyphomicrobium sp.]
MSALKRRAYFSHLTLHRTTGIAGALASAIILSPLPASADPAGNPAHAIANRFAEDAQRAEAQRKEAAQKQAQQRREQAAKAAKEKAQKAHEAEMLARARVENEERRKLEEEAARLDAMRAEREARESEAERQRAEKARQIEAAREAEQARVAEEARKAEEIKRAAEALRIAAEQAAAEEARKAEAARLAEAERRAEEARRAEQAAWAAEEAKRAAELRKAEEIRKAEETRKAEEVRKASEAQRIAAERAAAEAAARAETERRATEASRAVQRATSDDARRVADIEADAEIARVAESLRRIREEQLARHTGPASGTITGTVQERAHEPSSGQGRITDNEGFRDVPLAPPRSRAGTERPALMSPEPKLAYDGHVTILLQMEPRYRRGRGYESMDPVLCTAGGCYVSNGPDQPATFLHGNRAVRFGNAIGRRAGACNHATTCVFRNVDLGALPADVQPVDIRVIRHDRREPERIETLSSCRAGAGDRVTCTGAIHGDGYTMWVISEAAAERLPPHAFESAFDGGLVDSAEADPKLNPWRDRW